MRRAMDDLAQSLYRAAQLLLAADSQLWSVVGLSLRVSGTACLIGAALGLAAGAWLAMARFPGHAWVVGALNTLLALPSVVVGLVVYLLLSRAGPLGDFGILFTPAAMIVAQTILITPIIAALSRQVVADAWSEYREQLTSLGATTPSAALTLIVDTRYSLATVLLAGFGRAIAEVGAVMIVGGNIDGVTRVMTTTIALETSKGDLPLALALGIVLIAIVLVVNAVAQYLREWARLRYG